MKKIISVLLAVFLLVSVLPLAVSAEEGEFKTVLINENGDYLLNENDYDAVDIDGVTGTVTLSNAGVYSQGRSAIKVMNNSDVTFVLDGYSTVMGDSSNFSCGIEVELGSKVTFEGEGTLDVTGGKYGAAIGSYGTGINIPEEQRVQVGEITINSGVINAYGGYRGAGIGAGYHVSGNLITINGGTVRAYAGEQGAGIGSGYGTSGGAIGVAAVGEYTAGTIIINGGDIYAASSKKDFTDFSSFDAINANEVPGAWGVGIGGGYGASVDLIEINGGKVVAVSGASGAAIGTGRGTSKANQYNPDAYHCNIRIGGDADVTAVTSDVTKDSDRLGGAAIGTGRGCHTGGNIEITGNAKVTAINASLSPAIGATKKVSPVDGVAIPVAESIVIGDNVQLYAVSAADYAVDKDASALSINDNYFGSSDRWFFGEDAAAIADVANVKVESTKGEQMYTAPTGAVSVWSRIKAAEEQHDEPVVPEKDDKGNLRIDVPLKMAVVFEDGTVYYGGEMKEVEVGKEYHFQMCSVNWDNGTFDDNGNGIRGTVVYTMEVVHRNEFKELAAAAKEDPERYTVKGIDIIDNVAKKIIIDIDAKDTHLETDVNNFFMAYRFHFKGQDYNKQTGIAQVVNTPLESLSVNLPLGSTITCNAYHSYEKVDSADVFIENNSGEGVYDDVYLTSVNDYTWE